MKRGTALVTGSSSGFGLRTCVALAARGFEVWASMRDLERAEPLREALRVSGFGAERVHLVALDITDADARTALVEEILEQRGAVDVLVNNAGQMLTGFAEELDEQALRKQFETNFFGLVELTKALLPAMRERRWGRVINVSSISGRNAIPAYAGYCASKFALEGWSESLRYELVPFNVFVCLVEPGLFPTELFGRNRVDGGAGSGVYAKLRVALKEDTRRLQRVLAGADPDVVARVIGRIALAQKPALRHPVGIDAWVGTVSLGPVTRAWWEARVTQLFRR
jgi:NAD(P)-dependent dehydrogenase (short-subunit alcohol dehydrogenase family)